MLLLLFGRELRLGGLLRALSIGLRHSVHRLPVRAIQRGGVLLGAHLGSFAILHGLAARCPAPVKMLMHRGNAGAFTAAVERLDPTLLRNVIPVGDTQSMLRVHEAVSAGALVGILADRAPGGSRCVAACFLGRPAAFPSGPFIMAASLGVPVLTFRGVRTGPGRYQVVFAPFADRIVLRRAQRQADLAAVVERYVTWLEEGCRAHPYNWFNFFPFWQIPGQDDRAAAARVAAASAGAGANVINARVVAPG